MPFASGPALRYIGSGRYSTVGPTVYVAARAEAAAINAQTALANTDLLQQQVSELTARMAVVEAALPSPDLTTGGLL